jgi:hypothetical protein
MEEKDDDGSVRASKSFMSKVARENVRVGRVLEVL